MANIISKEKCIVIDGASIPLNSMTCTEITNGAMLSFLSGTGQIKLMVSETTLDGTPVENRTELITFLQENCFSITGGYSGGNGAVSSVNGQTGDVILTFDTINGSPTVEKVPELPVSKIAGLQGLLDGKQNLSQKGQALGYTPLDAAGLVPLQHLNISGLTFKGAWNAATNTPTLLDGEGNVGDFYKVSVPGTYNFGNGSFTFVEGDWVIFAAGVWQRLGSSEIVNSVNGKIGMVVIGKSDVGLTSVDDTSDMNKPISNPTKTYVDNALGSLTSLISSTTVNGFKIDEYTDRFEYKAKIPFTFNFATGVSHWTITTAFILPVGVTVGSSDEHYISIMNSNRAIGVSTWDGSDRAIRIGFFNTYTAGAHTATGSIFIKLVKYK